jgi:Amt family ammonium transporter
LAAAPFVPPWAALVIGLLGGFLFSFVLYLTNVVMRLRDAAATVAFGLVGGLWGLLSVALFADGQAGQGWNGITATSGDGGVIGVIFGGGAGQLMAQLVGIVAVGLWGLLWGGLFRRKLAPVIEAEALPEATLPPEVMPQSSVALGALSVAEEEEPALPEAIPEEVSHPASHIEDEDPVTNSQESD